MYTHLLKHFITIKPLLARMNTKYVLLFFKKIRYNFIDLVGRINLNPMTTAVDKFILKIVNVSAAFWHHSVINVIIFLAEN